jgi:hypothetical protein
MLLSHCLRKSRAFTWFEFQLNNQEKTILASETIILNWRL